MDHAPEAKLPVLRRPIVKMPLHSATPSLGIFPEIISSVGLLLAGGMIDRPRSCGAQHTGERAPAEKLMSVGNQAICEPQLQRLDGAMTKQRQ